MTDRAEEIARKLVVDHAWECGGTEGLGEAIADALRASEERAREADEKLELEAAVALEWMRAMTRWQVRAEAAEARVKELEASLRDVLIWAGPIAGDNQDKEAAEFEGATVDRARSALGEKP